MRDAHDQVVPEETEFTKFTFKICPARFLLSRHQDDARAFTLDLVEERTYAWQNNVRARPLSCCTLTAMIKDASTYI